MRFLSREEIRPQSGQSEGECGSCVFDPQHQMALEGGSGVPQYRPTIVLERSRDLTWNRPTEKRTLHRMGKDETPHT